MRYVTVRLWQAVLTGAVLALVAGLALAKCDTGRPGSPFTQRASVTTTQPGETVPQRQVVDDLYKSLAVRLPGGQTLICILTQVPQSFPHFTIPPEYTCERAP